jgi:hypothetical protein
MVDAYVSVEETTTVSSCLDYHQAACKTLPNTIDIHHHWVRRGLDNAMIVVMVDEQT